MLPHSIVCEVSPLKSILFAMKHWTSSMLSVRRKAVRLWCSSANLKLITVAVKLEFRLSALLLMRAKGWLLLPCYSRSPINLNAGIDLCTLVIGVQPPPSCPGKNYIIMPRPKMIINGVRRLDLTLLLKCTSGLLHIRCLPKDCLK